MVDGITAVGVTDMPMDRWGIDILLSGSQKAFMLPPGLAFIALRARLAGDRERQAAALLLRPEASATICTRTPPPTRRRST
jgi:aspartate aminotransferase-like enzyme